MEYRMANEKKTENSIGFWLDGIMTSRLSY